MSGNFLIFEHLHTLLPFIIIYFLGKDKLKLTPDNTHYK